MTNDTPNYATWAHDQLVHVAQHYHQQVVQMHEAIEQLRLDLRAAMAENRKLLTRNGVGA